MFVADRPTTAVDNYININRINAARWRQTGYGRDRNTDVRVAAITRRTHTHGGHGGLEKRKQNNNLFISVSPRTAEVFRVSLDFLVGKIFEQKQTDVIESIIRPGKGENIGRFKTCFGNGNTKTLNTCHSSFRSSTTDTCRIEFRASVRDFPGTFTADV